MSKAALIGWATFCYTLAFIELLHQYDWAVPTSLGLAMYCTYLAIEK